jgi:hypothetical protein
MIVNEDTMSIGFLYFFIMIIIFFIYIVSCAIKDNNKCGLISGYKLLKQLIKNINGNDS